MNYKDKNILVVGGSSGIGLALVNLLLQEGANVYNLSRKPSAEWQSNVNHLTGDVTADLSGIADALPQQLHGLVYSVGSITLKPFNRLSDDDFMNDYRINVLGAVNVLQQSLRALKSAQGASVVLISSVAANTGMSFHASIASAKAAVQGLALSLAAELAPHQVRVNVVAPSLTNTPLAQSLLNTSDKQEVASKRHPIGKYGQPMDIANTIAFLLSDNSSWITGQVIGIDGGLGKLR